MLGFSAGLDDLVLGQYIFQRNNFMKAVENDLTKIYSDMKYMRG